MVLRKYTGVPIHLHPRSLRRAEEEGPGATRPRCIIFQRGHQLREYINSKRKFTFGQCPNSMIDEQPINLHWQRAELGAGLQRSQPCLFKSIRNPWGFSSSSSPIINISCQIYPQYSGKWIRFGEAYASLRMKWGSRMIQWQFLPSNSMSPPSHQLQRQFQFRCCLVVAALLDDDQVEVGWNRKCILLQTH